MSNPIELMIQLAINNEQSKENLNRALSELKKSYEKSPVTLQLDFNKEEALRKLNSFITEASRKAISLDINIDQKNTGLDHIQRQAQSAQQEFKKLQDIMNKPGSGSSKSFDLDLDKILVQIDNMSRKGIVARESIEKFRNSIEALRGTGDRLKLKEIVIDMFDIGSTAAHSDKVLQSLSNALIRVGKAQQELQGIKDKFTIDPNVNTEYSRLATSIQKLTDDLFKLQTISRNGGADQVQLAGQIREVEARLKDARAEMTAFHNASKADSTFTKTAQEAQNLYNELAKIGRVSPQALAEYENELRDIGNSTATATAKTKQLEEAMARMNAVAKNTRMDTSFTKQLQSQELQLDKLESKLIRIGQIHKTTMDKMEFRRLTDELKALNNEFKNTGNLGQLDAVRTRYAQLAAQVERLGAEASTASRASQGLGYAFSQAMQKFPVWMLSATLFYAPVRGIQDLTEKVIELDSALVQLRRVMDVDDYKFDTLIQQMIQNVDELASKTSDYMKLVGDFARTGLDDVESQEMANVATILQNISELTPDETINALTAAMTAYAKDGATALDIANKLNEVDNNYAITTRDLAVALGKTATTAQVYGVELDKLLGYTTAIGVATRESGSVIGNSLKSIFARITTNSSAINALSDIGINITNSAGEVRDVSDIIDELAQRWDSLSKAQQQNTSVGIAGMYQQNRFNALMLNYGMALDATESAQNSHNSAMREQLIYAESLEARINKLQNAWYGLASAMGESVLYDTIVVLTKGMQSATEGSGSLISNLGALGPIFGIVSIAVLGFSKSFRTLVFSMQSTIATAYTTSASTTVMGRAMDAAKVSAISLTGALRGLATATIVGAIFVAIGFALEKLIGKMSEFVQEQEKIDTIMKTGTDAMSTYKEETTKLLDEYNKFAEAKASGKVFSDEEEQRYLQVMNQLGDTFPALIDHVDQTGQAHLKSAEAIKAVVAEYEKLAVAEAKAFKDSGFQDSVKEMQKSVSGSFLGNLFKKSAEQELEERKKFQEELKKLGKNDPRLDADIIRREMEINQKLQGIYGETRKLLGLLFEDANLKAPEGIKEYMEDFISSLDISDMEPEKLQSFIERLTFAMIEYYKAIQSGDPTAIQNAATAVSEIASEAKNAEEALKGGAMSVDGFTKHVKDMEDRAKDASDALGLLGEATEGVADSMDDSASAVERLAGTTESTIEAMRDLLWEYDMLSNALSGYTEQQLKDIMVKENLTDEELKVKATLEGRLAIMEKLAAQYPWLLALEEEGIALSKEQVHAVEQQIKAEELLLKAFQMSRDGKLTAEQDMTVTTTKATVERIKKIMAEIAALQLLQDQMYNTAMTNQEFLKGIDDGTVKDTGHSFAVPKAVSEWELERKKVDLSELQGLLDNSLGSIESFTSAIEKNDKAGKNSNKTTKDSIYVTDVYKQKIDALTAAIQKLESLRAESVKGSNKSRDLLQKQIALENERLKVMQAQQKSLQQQIKTGKVLQTGNVSGGKTTSTVTSSGTAWGGRISSTFGSRADNHRGVDLAASQGTSITAAKGGKVIKAGDAKSQGMHWSYGNLVVVQDSDGMKHIYAHMEKVLAKVGDQIEAGVQIGTVGSTGNSTGPHLHYEQNTSSGKVVDPTSTVNAIRNGGLTSTTSGVVATGQESLDKARSELTQIDVEIAERQAAIRALEAEMVSEMLQNFENQKDVYNRTLDNIDSNMQKVSQSSAAYRFELDKQAKTLSAKRKVNQEELIYLQNVLAKGKLSDQALFDLQGRLHELKLENDAIDFAINDNFLEKVASLNAMLEETVNKYDKLRAIQQFTMDYQSLILQEVDASSKEYLDSLEKINSAMRQKQNFNRQELTALQALINTGQLYGEALTNAKQNIQDLQLEIKQLQIDLQENNFEILVNVKTKSDQIVDDINFELSRISNLRDLTTEGDGDYKKYTEQLIEQQKLLAKQHLATRDALREELKQQDISAQRAREAKKLIQEEHLAYQGAEKAIKDYTKALEDAGKAKKEELVSKVINALKNAYQELRDDVMRNLDAIAERERKAHEERLKQINDEREAFRRNIEEQLRLIDRQEADRGYSMDIADMEEERNKVQQAYNKLENEDTYEARKKRKQLQEQLDKIDKEIAERRHQRDIELQKQGLNDLLEAKEAEIEGRLEQEDEAYQKTVESIDKQKKYWEKYYSDLLNDERKWAQVREDIMNGHFDKIEAEMREHIQNLIATMPELADTLDGTMQAVGTAIRQNVIDELQNAITALHEFKALAETIGSVMDGFNPGDLGSGVDTGGATGNSLSKADLDVLMGKFLYDYVAPQLSGNKATSARDKGRQLGQSGYKAGSTVDESSNFNSAISGMTQNELNALKQYLNSQKGSSGGAYDSFIDSFLKGSGSTSGVDQGVGSSKPNIYGVSSPMSYGDMQVMMAKYMREYLIGPSTPQVIKDQIKGQADQIANAGRSAGSKISSDVAYQTILKSFNTNQKNQLKSFFGNQANVIQNYDLQQKMKNYAASLDTGGMLNFSGKGIDGKGGKALIAHDGEVINNPLEVEQQLRIAKMNETLAANLASIGAPIGKLVDTMSTLISNLEGGGDMTPLQVTFQGHFGNMTQNDLNGMLGQAYTQLRSTQGRF